jgi:hypothetical protein
MKILHGQTCYFHKQIRFQHGDNVLERVFVEIGQIHECKNQVTVVALHPHNIKCITVYRDEHFRKPEKSVARRSYF